MSLLQPAEAPRPRVVVADDGSDVRDLVTIVLDHRGFEVVGVADGRDALDAILAGGCDGVVSDLAMPRLDGLALSGMLRALRASATLPIVMFTGAAEDDPRLGALHKIAQLRILHKPMGLSAIASTLAQMMGANSSHQIWDGG